MNGAEIFLLAGAGYVCGLAVSSGFILSVLMQLYVKDKAAWRMLAWAVYMIVNTVTAGLIPIFLVGVLVVGNHPNRPDFWPRILLFGAGIGIGMLFVLVSAHLIGRHLRRPVGVG